MGRHLVLMSTTTKAQVLLLTQENAADLHSLGREATTFGGKHIDPVKNMSLCHFMTFFPHWSPFVWRLVHSKLKNHIYSQF